MSTAVRLQEAKIKNISVTEDTITAQLVDGRTISVPLAWSWRLSEATPKQRANFRIIGDGHGVHWPDIDEDISAEGMLHGIPAPRPSKHNPNPNNTKTVANNSIDPTRFKGGLVLRSAFPVRLMPGVLPSLRSGRMRELSSEQGKMRSARGEPGVRNRWASGPLLNSRINPIKYNKKR